MWERDDGKGSGKGKTGRDVGKGLREGMYLEKEGKREEERRTASVSVSVTQ